MNTSDTINELAAALSKAQAVMNGATKDATNPAFKSKYADLASVWEACRKALTANGLSVLQTPRGIQTTTGGWAVELETRLFHASGQWVSDTLTVPVGKPDAQGVGSAITYARRYALASFVGVAPEDDDGNAAVTHAAPPAPAQKPGGFDEWFWDLTVVAESGTAALQKAWSQSDTHLRDYATKHQKQAWESLKAKAAKAVVA